LEETCWYPKIESKNPKNKGGDNMSRNLIERLTEGVVNRDLQKEGAALLNKWEKTGLLEGLANENQRAGMARLLENQAKQLLKESTSMAQGDVQGFSAVAFPLVRRVFAGLLAQDLVSVQPMSLPSGLIFFLDFTTSGDIGGATSGGLPRLGYGSTAESLYGGGVVASQITGGVSLTGTGAEAGPYALNNGYASPTGSVPVAAASVSEAQAPFIVGNAASTDKLIRFDPDLASGSYATVVAVTMSAVQADSVNLRDLVAFSGTLSSGYSGSVLVRRLTTFEPSTRVLSLVYSKATSFSSIVDAGTEFTGSFPLKDSFTTTGAPLGGVVGQDTWGLENQARIPEIDIKVDSIAVTAITKKLKAKWTPELGQDLNAYHNLDAEVELTSILSEQIALEIDREILEDLIKGATAGTYYWSRSPGLFVNRTTGVEVGASAAAPEFTGNVSMWYETLIETINDVSAQIHRKTLRGGANFIVTSPEVANILEFTAGFRASVTADDERGTIGAVKVGSLSKKWDVYVDPYFPRNLVLVGRRGGSFLESGYVYAPYVPLQVTPTIFGTEDFVPRKGVMTRYAKKMVRPDMYGLVVVRGLLGEGGLTS
jgi:hypothetical protein